MFMLTCVTGKLNAVHASSRNNSEAEMFWFHHRKGSASRSINLGLNSKLISSSVSLSSWDSPEGTSWIKKIIQFYSDLTLASFWKWNEWNTSSWCCTSLQFLFPHEGWGIHMDHFPWILHAPLQVDLLDFLLLSKPASFWQSSGERSEPPVPY